MSRAAARLRECTKRLIESQENAVRFLAIEFSYENSEMFFQVEKNEARILECETNLDFCFRLRLGRSAYIASKKFDLITLPSARPQASDKNKMFEKC